MIGGEGSTYGKYFLIKRLAMGGMGEIFLAKLRGPVGFKKLLVVKRILPHHTSNDQFVNMFFAEARIAAQLSHPHIVQIYEMGEIEGSYYLAMEYVAGKPLREVIDRARKLGESVPPAHAAAIIADLCGGLSFAHNAKGLSGGDLDIIHRDVNPANLLLSYSGDLKLIDFGIAKTNATKERTETGTIKGKFVYMSPEQSAAQPLDKRSDIFSVGICLYETLTGTNPFIKSNAVLSMDAIQRLDPPPLSQHSRKLAPFDGVMMRALAKKRDDRYNDCSELADDLHALLRSGAIDTPPTSLAEYMNDLFEEQISAERRIIATALENTNTDIVPDPSKLAPRRATVGQGPVRHTRQLTREEQDAITGGHRPQVMDDNGSTVSRQRRNSGRTLAEEAGLETGSRLPFFLMLAIIVIVTIVGSVWIAQSTIAHRRTEAMEGAMRIMQQSSTDTDLADPNVKRMIEKAQAIEPIAPNVEELVVKSGQLREEPAPPKVGAPETPPKPEKKSETRKGDKAARATTEKPERADKERAAKASGEKAEAEKKTSDDAAKIPTAALGSVQITTDPALKLARGGRGSSVRIADSGDFVVGSGSSAVADPFALTVRYAVLDDAMTYTFEPEPWAIITCNNATSGRSPQTVKTSADQVTCDFANPKEGRKLHVTLKRTR